MKGSISGNQGVFWQPLPKPGLVQGGVSGIEDDAARKDVGRRFVIRQRQPKLLEIVAALTAPGGFPGGLHSRQQAARSRPR